MPKGFKKDGSFVGKVFQKGNQNWLGRKHNEESKRKNRLWHIGKKYSEETNKKKGSKGEKNYFWEGGITNNPYSIDWTETLKRSIRERDNYICQLCSQYGNVVHHIDYDKKNSNPTNLITLCKKCHIKTNFNRNYWLNYFKGRN